MSLIAYFHDDMFHITLVHSPYLMFSHGFVFMSTICTNLDFECFGDHVIYIVSWNIILFYSLLEGFRTSYTFFIKLVRILHYGRAFQTYYIFKLIFWKPLPIQGRLVGRPCLVCLILKILLNMCMKWVERNMCYKLDLIVFFNWYH